MNQVSLLTCKLAPRVFGKVTSFMILVLTFHFGKLARPPVGPSRPRPPAPPRGPGPLAPPRPAPPASRPLPALGPAPISPTLSRPSAPPSPPPSPLRSPLPLRPGESPWPTGWFGAWVVGSPGGKCSAPHQGRQRDVGESRPPCYRVSVATRLRFWRICKA